MEKLAFALVTAARKLKPYFQSPYGEHPDQQALATGDEQSRDYGSTGVIGYRVERI